MYKNVAHMFFERVAQRSEHNAVQFKEHRGTYQLMSWKKYGDLVTEIGYGLAANGLEPGGTVAIFSQGTYLWVAADFATISNGAKSVPIYPTSSNADIEAILANSQASIVFVQDEKLLQKILNVRNLLPALEKIIVLKEKANCAEITADPQVSFIDVLCQSGKALSATQPNLLADRTAKISVTDPATIIYTSGTTGVPKGAVLTHHNILSVIDSIRPVLPITEADVYLSYLPLSHVFERICGEFYWAHCGGVMAFAESIETMAKNLGEVEPTMMLVVPRVLDRIYTKVKSGIAGASPRAQKLIDWALEVGKEVVRTKSDGRSIRLGLKIKHALSERLVYKKLRDKIGKKLRLVVSGGAPATASAIEFFNSIGIPTVEGYGLTETCAPSHVNPPGRVKIGTVGPRLPGVEVKIAEDGEILLKGPSIVQGYFMNEQFTADSFKDGWFHTGDIGTEDNDGYLRITDRKKDLIINAAGKNIAPQRIETLIKSIPLVSQAVVFGDKQKALVGLITFDELAAVEYAREHNWQFQDFSDLVTSDQLNGYLRKELKLRSGQLADYEQVKKFRILPHDLSVEAGELTATLKVKRNAIAKKYAETILELYGSPADEAEAELSKARR
ncbi:MAG TPA: long-chain fatty acid--CoA ligase [Oculatellaceae cyanobacterium]